MAPHVVDEAASYGCKVGLCAAVGAALGPVGGPVYELCSWFELNKKACDMAVATWEASKSHASATDQICKLMGMCGTSCLQGVCNAYTECEYLSSM